MKGYPMAIDTVFMEGNANSSGMRFGDTRRWRIEAYLSQWLDSLRRAGVGEPEEYLSRMLRDTRFVDSVREYAPDLLEYVSGIASACAQPFDLVFASQLMDEEWEYRRQFLADLRPPEKCSSVAILCRGGPTLIGQNMDLGPFTDGHQVLLRVARSDSEPEALIFSVGCMIGLMGVNARGIALCVNSLPQLSAAREGVPVAFMIRKILQANSMEEAVQTVKRLPHATGQHYLIADCDGIRSFEASATGVVEYRAPDPGRVLHTNHPLSPIEQRPSSADDLVNTVARLSSLSTRLLHGEPGVDEIKDALSASDDPDHPVRRILDKDPGNLTLQMGAFTTGSMISALHRGATQIDTWVSSGPPLPSDYEHFTLRAGEFLPD